MKNKHCYIFSLIAAPVCALLRLVQYLTVIDADGYFVTATLQQKIISYSVYGVIALAAVFALISLATGNNNEAKFFDIFSGKGMGYLCIIAALCIMTMSGLRLGSSPHSVPTVLNYALCGVGILAAIGIALYGIGALSGGFFSESHGFGVILPIYFMLLSISEFFASFERSHKSESKLYMVALCALCLFMVSFCLITSSVTVSNKRLVSTAVLYAVCASPITVVRLPFINPTTYDIVESVLHTALVIIAIIILHKAKPNTQQKEAENGNKLAAELDKFIHEIPDEDEDN